MTVAVYKTCMSVTEKYTHLRQCRGPGGDMRATLGPLTVVSWTSDKYKVMEEDCRRVFTTSSGQVNMAPTVPPHLADRDKKKAG